MDHPPWSTYSQHYPRLNATGTNPLAQTGQLNDLGLSRQDMSSYSTPGASPLLLPAHHTLNTAPQPVPHSDTPFVNTANHLLTTPYHDSMLSTFPPSTKGHHPLTPLNMPPHTHSGAMFKNLGKETEINELRGGFSRRSAGLPVTNAPSGVTGGMASGGMFNSQSSPHSWRPPDIMPTPSSPFGVLPHETVMHRSNADTPTSSTPKPPHPGKQTPRPDTSGTRYMEEHGGYRNVLGHQGAMIDNNSRPPALMMPTNQPDVKGTTDYYHGTARTPVHNYLNHQFPNLEVHPQQQQQQQPHQHQTPCAGPSPAAMKPELFAHQVTSVAPPTPSSSHNSSQGNSPSPALNQAMVQRNATPVVSVANVANVASPSQQGRDMSTYSTFPTAPTIPTHSQSFLANQMPTGIEFNGDQQMRPILTAPPPTTQNLNAQNQFPSLPTTPQGGQMNHGAARVAGIENMYAPMPSPYNPNLLMNVEKNKITSLGMTSSTHAQNTQLFKGNDGCMGMNNNNLTPKHVETPMFEAPHLAPSNINPQENQIEMMQQQIEEEEEQEKEESKRRKKRKRRRDRHEPRITPMTPVQANKLSHKMAPPLSVPLHHPPVTSPLDLSSVETDALQHLQPTTDIIPIANTNDGASTSAPSSLSSPDAVQLSPPQLPSTPASVSNPGSVPEKSTRVTMTMSIEDDLGFLAELPPACNIRHQKRTIVPNAWNQRVSNGSFQDVFLRFVKGTAAIPPTNVVEIKKSTRGRKRGPVCAAAGSRTAAAAAKSPAEANSVFYGSAMKDNEGEMRVKEVGFGKKDEGMLSERSGIIPSEEMVPNPEAPKFSSDEEFSPMGLESLVHSAIQGLSDAEEVGSASARGMAVPSETPLTDLVSTEATNGHAKSNEDEKQNPIKIKLIGLHSGNVQTAKRGRGRRRKSQIKMEEGEEMGDDVNEKAVDQPVRRVSMRKCKEAVLQRRVEGAESSDSEKEGRDDSDGDPAWTPLDKDAKTKFPGTEDDKKRKYTQKKPARRLSGTMTSPVPTTTTTTSTPPTGPRRGRPPKIRPDTGPPPVTKVLEEEEDGLWKPGDFVVAVADLVKPNPPIWRVDGKALLHKFEAFEQEKRILYRNKSTYAGWTCNNRAQYQTVSVRLVNTNKYAVVVEWDRGESVVNNVLVDNASTGGGDVDSAEFIPQKESFEVYLQTLISQVLDPNFISEIIKEQDEYFLSHVQVVDTIVERCKEQVLTTVNWTNEFKETIERSPRLTVSGYSEQVDCCQVCQQQEVLKKAIFTRLDYDYVTLAYTQPLLGEGISQCKLCSRCADMVWLYNQVHHQKFNFYHQCTAKVLEMREADPSKESHIILQYCLLDGAWINKLLKEVQSTWQRCLRLKR